MDVRDWIDRHPKTIMCVTGLSLLTLAATYFVMSPLPRMRRERERKAHQRAAAERRAKINNPVVKGNLIFRGTMIRVKEPSGYLQPLPQRTATVKCGDSLDVMWSRDAVLFMKTKGIFERTLVADGVHFSDLEWDGQHIWVAVPQEGIWIVDTNA